VAAETKRARVPKTNTEHHVHIKNMYYCCIHLTCIRYYLNKLNLNFFQFGLHEK
jgi:hypothetical protein